MPHPALEVADIFRNYGSSWRQSHAGHLSLGQLKVTQPLKTAVVQYLAVMYCIVNPVSIMISPITLAVIDIAQNVRPVLPIVG